MKKVVVIGNIFIKNERIVVHVLNSLDGTGDENIFIPQSDLVKNLRFSEYEYVELKQETIMDAQITSGTDAFVVYSARDNEPKMEGIAGVTTLP